MQLVGFTILYIKLNVCMFVCTLYKFTFLNQCEPNFVHIPPPLGMEKIVGYVWTNFFFFFTFRPFSPSLLRALADYRTKDGRRVPITGQKMAAGASHPRQRYIRDSSRS